MKTTLILSIALALTLSTSANATESNTQDQSQSQGQGQAQSSRATSYGSKSASTSGASSNNSFSYNQEDRGFKDIPNWAYVPGAASAYAAPSSAIGQKTFGIQIPWLGFSGSTDDDLTRAMAVSAYANSTGNTTLRRSADQVMQYEMDQINISNRGGSKNVSSTSRSSAPKQSPNTGPFGF